MECGKELTVPRPLHDKATKGVAYEHGGPGERLHNAPQVCCMLREAACLHAWQPVTLALRPQAHSIAVESSCCKVGQKVLLHAGSCKCIQHHGLYRQAVRLYAGPRASVKQRDLKQQRMRLALHLCGMFGEATRALDSLRALHSIRGCCAAWQCL